MPVPASTAGRSLDHICNHTLNECRQKQDENHEANDSPNMLTGCRHQPDYPEWAKQRPNEGEQQKDKSRCEQFCAEEMQDIENETPARSSCPIVGQQRLRHQ